MSMNLETASSPKMSGNAVASIEPALEKRKRIEVLDALRGIAALIVVWHHIFVLFPEPMAQLEQFSGSAYTLANTLSNQNHNAVLCFFVLSGFSIRLSLRGSALETKKGFGHYAWRRAIRILPLYWFALAWTFAFGIMTSTTGLPSFSFQTLAGNLTFLQTSAHASGRWFVPYGQNGPLWSLSYEVFYYLLLPALLVVSRWAQRRQPSADVMLIVSFVLSLIALALNWLSPNPFTNFLSLWHVWMLGYYLADTWTNQSTPWLVPVSGVILIALFAALGLLGQRSDTLESLRNGAIIASLGAATIFVQSRFSFNLLSLAGVVLSKVFKRIGHGSYALYLLHYPLLLSFAKLDVEPIKPGGTLLIWGMIGVILVFAVLVCPMIESSFIRLKNVRLPRRATTSPAKATPNE